MTTNALRIQRISPRELAVHSSGELDDGFSLVTARLRHKFLPGVDHGDYRMKGQVHKTGCPATIGGMMQEPIEMCFRNMDRSMVLMNEIEKRVEDLEGIQRQISNCQVIVEAPHWNNPGDTCYRTRIKMTANGRTFTVGQNLPDGCAHKDPFISIQRAFEAIRRKLEPNTQEPQETEKPGHPNPHGQITKICSSQGPDQPDCNYGIISTCDGREVYFEAESLCDVDFQRLELGSEVDFVEESDIDGSHATAVRLVGQRPQVASV